MSYKKECIAAFSVFLLLSICIFWRSILRGDILFPGNYLMAFFSPYKSYAAVPIANKPVADDVFRHIFTFKTLALDMMKQGKLPLWNPYNGSGMPLLATFNSGFFDPINFLYGIFPDIQAWNISLFLQFFCIGFFTYLYCRKLRLSHLSSFFSATAFVFSSLVVSRVTLGAYGTGIAMLPLSLFFIEWYIQNKQKFALVGLAVATFVLMVSTHPQISLYILVTVVLYALTKSSTEKGNRLDKVKQFLLLLLFLFIGGGLTGIQIFPTLELVTSSHMGIDTSTILRYLLSWYHLVSILIPNYFGNISTYNFWGKTDYIETAASIGAIPCLLTYIAISQNAKKYTFTGMKKFFITSLIVSCFLAVESPVTRLLTSIPIPLISADPPSRILLITIYSFSILAGFGLDMLRQKEMTIKTLVRHIFPYLLFLLFILFVTAYYAKTNHPCRVTPVLNCFAIALRNTLFEYASLGIGLLLIGTALFVHKKYKPFLYSGLIFLIFVTGLYNADKFLPFSPKNTVLPSNQIITYLTDIKTYDRVYGVGEAMMTTNLATYFRLYDPQYYHPLYITRYGELTGYANTGIYGQGVIRGDAIINASPTESAEETFRRNRLLSILGVKYVVYNNAKIQQSIQKPLTQFTDQTNSIVENTDAVPRATIVTNTVFATNPSTLLSTLFNPDFNPITTVVLEKDPKIASASSTGKGTAAIKQYSENEILIDTQTNTSGILVLSDNYYPGWHAYVDGKITEILRANYSFRAVVIPTGTHKVRFAYEPDSVKIGILVSSISLLLLIGVSGILLLPKKKTTLR
jgi:hypothetical protein